MMTRIIIFFLLTTNLCFAQNQRSYIKEGNEYFKSGDLEQAIVSYNKVINAAYKNTALLNKGTALFKLKKYDEAINTYKVVSASSNANKQQRSGAYYNIGVVYSNQKKIEASIDAYKSALRLNPTDNNARENLQKALTELSKKGGGGGDQKPQQSKPNLKQNEAQQQLKRLEQKEKSTQDKVSNKKNQSTATNGKDW